MFKKRRKVKYKTDKLFMGNISHIKTILIRNVILYPRARNLELRKIESPNFYKRLIRSGRKINVPTLERIEGGKYRIIDGRHRIRALKQLKYKKIKAEIV